VLEFIDACEPRCRPQVESMTITVCEFAGAVVQEKENCCLAYPGPM
jgi:hypothetical protein